MARTLVGRLIGPFYPETEREREGGGVLGWQFAGWLDLGSSRSSSRLLVVVSPIERKFENRIVCTLPPPPAPSPATARSRFSRKAGATRGCARACIIRYSPRDYREAANALG
jgi:hypothetical protein